MPSRDRLALLSEGKASQGGDAQEISRHLTQLTRCRADSTSCGGYSEQVHSQDQGSISAYVHHQASSAAHPPSAKPKDASSVQNAYH